jgi:SAM-dependent methyltransferase
MRASDYADLYALEQDLWWFVGMRAITAALLDPLVPPGRDRLVLDAGCGTGANLAWLARYAGRGRVMGVDLVPAALGYCRDRGHESIAQASVTHLPLAERTFDLLTSFDVLGQVPGPGADVDALREMRRVLRPGGLAFIRVAAHEWMRSGHDAALGTFRRYALGGLVDAVERAGLRTVRATYAGGVLLPLAAFRRLVLARVGLAARGSDVRPLPQRWRWLDRALAASLHAEARRLRQPRATLPAGLSAICVAGTPDR